MSITRINPYINLGGDAEQAIAFYQRALGAKVEHMMRYGEMPATEEMKLAPGQESRVMHSELRIGAGVVMVSDTMTAEPVPRGGNVQVLLDFDAPADLDQKFEALVAGGTATMAPHDTFWGARFAMLTDAYGVVWMLHAPLEKA
jgi:PhnB protein